MGKTRRTWFPLIGTTIDDWAPAFIAMTSTPPPNLATVSIRASISSARNAGTDKVRVAVLALYVVHRPASVLPIDVCDDSSALPPDFSGGCSPDPPATTVHVPAKSVHRLR